MATHPTWGGKQAVLPFEAASVYFDGIFHEPQLNHPEGIAIDAQGNVWCGGERGEIYRIDREGQTMEQVASTGGFTLGLAIDPTTGFIYSCDLKLGTVFRYDPAKQELSRFADGDGEGENIRIPNAPVVDAERGYLYVSDSHNPQEAGPGIWRFDLETGKGQMWFRESMRFANGLAMSPQKDALFVVESFGRRVSRIPILPNGEPGEKEIVVVLEALPDGITFDAKGRMYISCYEPSLIYRWSAEAGLELFYYDPDAHMLCHPTNCVFRGDDMLISNLGRWHITIIPEAGR